MADSQEVASFRSLCVLLAAAVCMTVGCGGDGEKQKEQSDRPKLPCDKQEYPCTFEEVDEEVNQRTLTLMHEVLRRADRGEDWESAFEWLQEQPKVVEADGGANAIRFRLEGGRPGWVYLDQARASAAETTSASLSEAEASESSTRTSPIVAGGDEEPREPKQALVLTADHTMAPEVTNDVRATLAGARGYTMETVEFRTSENDIELSYFKNWGEYDFVYFLAHGGCIGEECRQASISSGIELGTLPEYPDMRLRRVEDGWVPVELTATQQEQKEAYEREADRVRAEGLEESEYAGTPGVAVAIRPNCHRPDKENFDVGQYGVDRCQNTYELALDAPFLRTNSDDMDESLVIGNSCKLFSNRASDIAEHFSTGDNVFLGWSDSVLAGRSAQVIPPLVDLLADTGVPAWTALETVERQNDVLDDECRQDDSCPPELRHSEREDTIRLREIVSVSGQNNTPVEDGSNLSSIVQGMPGDGQNDSLELNVVVAGIDQEASTASSNPGDYQVRFEWNGEGVGESYNVAEEGQPIPDRDHAHILDAIELQLGSDIDPEQEHSLTAIVELPEGGTSKKKAEGLFIDPCWANFRAGAISWDSEEVEATEPFGNVRVWRRDGEGFSGVRIALESRAYSPRMEATVPGEASIDEPGTYSAIFTVRNANRGVGYASPEGSEGESVRGDLVIDDVHERGSRNQLIRGSFEAPVTNDEVPTHTLTGSFSLPAVIIDNNSDPDLTGSFWPDFCTHDTGGE